MRILARIEACRICELLYPRLKSTDVNTPRKTWTLLSGIRTGR